MNQSIILFCSIKKGDVYRIRTSGLASVSETAFKSVHLDLSLYQSATHVSCFYVSVLYFDVIGAAVRC